MKYLFRDRLANSQALSTFFKDSSDTHPDHHDYHPHYEIYFREKPLAQQITLNGETQYIDTPALVLTAPFQIHAMSPADQDCKRYERHIIYFSEELLEGLLPPHFFAQNTNCLFPLSAADAALIARELPVLFDSTLPERERMLSLALLLTRLERIVPPESRRHFGQINAYIPQVLQYLYDHASGDLQADEIAALFHISRAKLNRDFRASVGNSLHSAVMDLRLSKAAHLLSTTALTVGEIAAKCGFSSAYYFHAFFKRATGQTPLRYRGNANSF
ncbi:MAG: helix-turn-helix transcriptional regulator [Ruminococcaceae bacterium]|nr:helix-turn-helix transcriptional regulator [Oscillospiraceae bacterium]